MSHDHGQPPLGGSHEEHPRTVLEHPCKLGLTRCPEDLMRDVIGVLGHPKAGVDLISGGSHEGHPKTVLGHPSWDPMDI